MLYRPLHHAHMIQIKGESYRLTEQRKAELLPPKSEEIIEKNRLNKQEKNNRRWVNFMLLIYPTSGSLLCCWHWYFWSIKTLTTPD